MDAGGKGSSTSGSPRSGSVTPGALDRAQVERLIGEYKKVRQSNSVLKSAFLKEQTRAGELEKRLAETEKQWQTEREAAEQLRFRVAELERSVAAASVEGGTAKLAEEKLGEAKLKLDTVMAERDAMQQQVIRTRQQSEEAIAELEGRVAYAEKRAQRQTELLSAARAEAESSLSKMNKQQAEAKHQVDAAMAALAKSRARTEQLQRQLHATDASVALLKQDLAASSNGIDHAAVRTAVAEHAPAVQSALRELAATVPMPMTATSVCSMHDVAVFARRFHAFAKHEDVASATDAVAQQTERLAALLAVRDDHAALRVLEGLPDLVDIWHVMDERAETQHVAASVRAIARAVAEVAVKERVDAAELQAAQQQVSDLSSRLVVLQAQADRTDSLEQQVRDLRAAGSSADDEAKQELEKQRQQHDAALKRLREEHSEALNRLGKVHEKALRAERQRRAEVDSSNAGTTSTDNETARNVSADTESARQAVIELEAQLSQRDARIAELEQQAKQRSVEYDVPVMDVSGAEGSVDADVSSAVLQRESEIRRFYDDKLQQAISQAHLADNRAIDVQRQYQVVLERAMVFTRHNKALFEALIEAKRGLAQLKETLDTTESNYQSQMKVMTEHMVTVNEEISAKQDEVAMLHSHKVLCGRCKTWNSVQWLTTKGLNGQRCSRGNHPSSYNFG